MADFLVHVVLHQAKLWGDYDILHTAMKNRGFLKWVTADDGTKYKLPAAEYRYSGEDINSVRELAKDAAAVTGHTFSLFVGAWTGVWTGHNLDRY